MSQKTNDGAKIITDMSREDFHHNFVRVVGQTQAFGALVSFGAKNISPEEKKEVKKALHESLGIPLAMIKSDDELDEIAAVASARAVALK